MLSQSAPASIAVRFGDEVLRAGFTAVPNLVLNYYAQLGITPSELVFIIHVWQHWWSRNDPYPSLRTIAEKMDVSRRQAQNYVQSLKAKNLLVVNERSDPEHGQI